MLRLDAVTAGYSGSPVLREVDLWVPPGRVVSLLGANGAGKTTLLRVASGLLRPRSGKLLVDGSDATGERPSQLVRRGICHVPEGRGIFPSLTVRENLLVAVGGRGAVDALDRAAAVFPILGERRDQQAGTLSGGQQQMLALAKAYVTSPRYVLLDEVSMGLAPIVVDEIFEFLQVLASTGCSLLLVEQYVGKALAVSDYVYLLSRGRITFAGEPSEIDEDALAQQYLSHTA